MSELQSGERKGPLASTQESIWPTSTHTLPTRVMWLDTQTLSTALSETLWRTGHVLTTQSRLNQPHSISSLSHRQCASDNEEGSDSAQLRQRL